MLLKASLVLEYSNSWHVLGTMELWNGDFHSICMHTWKTLSSLDWRRLNSSKQYHWNTWKTIVHHNYYNILWLTVTSCKFHIRRVSFTSQVNHMKGIVLLEIWFVNRVTMETSVHEHSSINPHTPPHSTHTKTCTLEIGNKQSLSSVSVALTCSRNWWSQRCRVCYHGNGIDDNARFSHIEGELRRTCEHASTP